MGSARRIGAPDAKNRGVLIDAAEKLLLEEGYAAVTSRRVAEKAGLKPQLVHYYFRTMEELFLAVFRRMAEAGEHLLAGVREFVYQRCLPLATRDLTITTARTGEMAGLLGAARLVVDTRLQPQAVDRLIAERRTAG